MNLYDQQDENTPKAGLINALMQGGIGNTGINGGRALPQVEQPKTELQPTGGDAMQIRASWDTSGMSPDQRNAFGAATSAANARDAAGFKADQDYLNANGGNWGSRQQYRPGQMPNAGDFGGVSQGGIGFGDTPSAADAVSGGGFAGPSQSGGTSQGWAPGAKAGQKVTLLGYDRGKLDDANYSTGKYNPEVRDFVSGLDADVGLSRGGLDNMVNYLRNAKGRKDAVAVGDDKIDFDGPQGPLPPIDVVRGGDNQIVFQDPRGVPGGGGGGGGAAGAADAAAHGGGGGGLASLLQGNAGGGIEGALGQYGDQSNFLAQLLAKLRGAQ